MPTTIRMTILTLLVLLIPLAAGGCAVTEQPQEAGTASPVTSTHGPSSGSPASRRSATWRSRCSRR